MKKKRYFCDVVLFPTYTENKKLSVLGILVLILSAFIVGIISYNAIMHTYGYELSTYSIDTVKYLEEISNIVIKEGYSFDANAIPKDDIYDFNISYTDKTIKLDYALKHKENLKYAPVIRMSIVLSTNNLKIIEKAITSKEEYVVSTKSSIILHSIFCGFIGMIIMIFVILIVLTFGTIISYCHKKIVLFNK